MSEIASKRNVAQGMARLKELLFDSEVETLGELDQRLSTIEAINAHQTREQAEFVGRLEQLFDRAGTEERFRSSVAVVLDKALLDAEQRNHKELSRAMAPLVVGTIKTELRNSRDELVGILYPITGRLVKSYVAAEIKKLSENVNSQIDKNPVMLRVRSLTSGKPVSDLAIAQSQRLSVEEVFLIRRGSGELLAHWPPSDTVLSNADVHMSGVLEAVNDFASSAFADDGGHFESFRYEDFQVYMRASPTYLLAARCNGVAPSGIEAIFDDEFLATIERVSELEDEAAKSGAGVGAATRSLELHPMAESVEQRTTKIYEDIDRTRIGGAVVKMLLFLIVVPLLTWLFWGWYTDAEEGIVRRSAEQVIAATPGLEGYHTGLEVGYRGKSIKVTGLAPNEATLGALKSALGRELPGTTIDARMAVIPRARVETVRPVEFDATELERRLQQRVLRAENQIIAASARRAVERALSRLRQALPELRRFQNSVPENDKKADIGEVRAALDKVIADILGTSKAMRSAGDDSAQLGQLVDPLNRSTGAVAGTIRSLIGLHDAGGAVGVIEKPAATTIVDAAEDISARAERLATLVMALNQTVAMIPEPVAPGVAPLPVSPDDLLRAFFTRNAIFFSSGTQYVSDVRNRKVLDEAAALIKKATALVRVVGYTDEKGDAARNSTLAQDRADRVVNELLQRGVARERLVGIGRIGGSFNLRPGAGESSPNRRVQFEIGFDGEVRR